MSEKHYVGEIGTEILVDCGSDISGASQVSLEVKKPDNTKVSWNASIEGTNYLKYIAVSGDLDIPGRYYLQASLTLAGWTGLGETTTFIIRRPYN